MLRVCWASSCDIPSGSTVRIAKPGQHPVRVQVLDGGSAWESNPKPLNKRN